MFSGIDMAYLQKLVVIWLGFQLAAVRDGLLKLGGLCGRHIDVGSGVGSVVGVLLPVTVVLCLKLD